MQEQEPLSAVAAKAKVRTHLEQESFLVSRHAKKEMLADDLSWDDVANVLRGGVISRDKGICFEGASWRYRLETTKMGVVVAFSWDADKMVIVTAFKFGGS